MERLNWSKIFGQIFKRSENALDWKLPEPWIHAELYNALKKIEKRTKWLPFDNEIPYITHFPFVQPTRKDRDWKIEGAVKWVDLCLRSKNDESWHWIEIKVRHAGKNNRQRLASSQARDAFKKDVVSLIGLNPKKTSVIWEKPDHFLIAYWFKELLAPRAKEVKSGKHHFTSVFLQLNGELDKEVWNEKALLNQIKNWYSSRKNESKSTIPFPSIQIKQFTIDGHSLVICEW